MIFRDKKLMIICFSFRGRRSKFYELQKRMFSEIRILSRGGGGAEGAIRWHTENDIKEQLRIFNPDIVHAYIDRSTPAVIPIREKYPVVIDMSDCALMRGQSDPYLSYIYSHGCPAIFSSRHHADFITKQFGIKDYKIIPNLVARDWLSFEPLSKLKGENIVYFGGISMSSAGNYGYRWYRDIFQIFNDNNIKVHIYPGIKRASRYENVKYHGFEGYYLDLLRELSQYQVGFAGYNDIRANRSSIDYAHTCLPNKAFDYMAAGIPTLGYNMGYSEWYVKRWGVCIPSIFFNNEKDPDKSKYSMLEKSLIGGYYKAKEKRIDFKKWQDKYNLDNYFDDLVQIYRNLMKKANKSEQKSIVKPVMVENKIVKSKMFYESELIKMSPPLGYMTWTEEAIQIHLKKLGFNLKKTVKGKNERGNYWREKE